MTIHLVVCLSKSRNNSFTNGRNLGFLIKHKTLQHAHVIKQRSRNESGYSLPTPDSVLSYDDLCFCDDEYVEEYMVDIAALPPPLSIL